MAKYVYFINVDGYRKYTAYAAQNAGAFIPNIDGIIKKKLFEIHNAWTLNKRCELPGKSIWYKYCFNEKEVDINEDLYFMCYESFHMAYSRKYLSYLRNKYSNAKFVFFFSNPVDSYNFEKLKSVRDLYDAVITFNNNDAKDNDFIYCNCDVFKLPPVSECQEYKSDVFFIGSDKGRLELLLSVYEKLTNAGLTCDFHIINVPEDKQRYLDKIKYNHRISYEEVLQRVKSTRCVLEILQNSNYYYSIRTIEALQYHKKLLTSNVEVVQQWFYKPEIIQCFDNDLDIDTAFVLEPIDKALYSDIDIGSFERFANFLENNIRRKEL